MSDYTIVLPVLEKTCANCSAAVEGSIRKEQGVESVSVNLSTEKDVVDGE
jgi:copper chaperone CopZ